MGSEQQETKSLPRNRKCGNCRFFEPAPLWRKGWCRNAQLYPPHANHLVDSTGIDCEGGFRSRIYWEPLPVAEVNVQPTPSMGTAPIMPRIYRTGSDAADSGQGVPPKGAESGFFGSPTSERTARVEPDDDTFFRGVPGPEPLIIEGELNRPEGPDWRADVRRRLPFTRNWPLERLNFNPMQVLPWAVAGLLAIIVLFVLFSGKKDATVTPDQAKTSAVATQNAQLVGASGTVNPTLGSALRGSVTPGAGTTVTPTAAASALKDKTATIGGLGGDVLRLRAQPNISSDILDKLKDGDKVKILEGPVDSDKLEWYKVEANGKVGWVVKKYVVTP